MVLQRDRQEVILAQRIQRVGGVGVAEALAGDLQQQPLSSRRSNSARKLVEPSSRS